MFDCGLEGDIVGLQNLRLKRKGKPHREMHGGSNGHKLTNCTHSEVSAINGEIVPTGWSKQLSVHPFPTRINGSILGKRKG